jgi:geranylgeranyl pyrophosphate synthase/predicted secreted hydrolase
VRTPEPSSEAALVERAAPPPGASPAAGPALDAATRRDPASLDLPRADAPVEWWYANARLRAQDGRALAVFAAFFRSDSGPGAPRAHSLAASVADLDAGRTFPVARLDPAAAAHALARLRAEEGVRDPRVNRAVARLLARGVPRPDRVFAGPARAAEHGLDLDFGGHRLRRRGDGAYEVEVADDGEGVAFRLALVPERAHVLGGPLGVVPGPHGEPTAHAFVPRLSARGEVRMPGDAPLAVSGVGWFDREAALPPRDGAPAAGRRPRLGWEWFALHLEGGTDVAAFVFRAEDGAPPPPPAVVVVDARGRTRRFEEASAEPLATSRSVRTFLEHPTAWRLVVPGAGLDLVVTARAPDAEVRTLAAEGAFWEGAADAAGTLDGAPASGEGFVERRGPRHEDLDAFFASVGREVRASVAQVLGDAPSPERLAALVSGPDRPDVAADVDPDAYARTVLRPVREVVERGGKAWRSWAALAAVEVVGGDSRPWARWLAMPELMHVGSLVVDDVEDRSPVRRGGPACHVVHGDATAINAGTASYFLAEIPLADARLPDAVRSRLYRLWFEAMRAGHAGQAIDLDGHAAAAGEAARTGDASLLERRVLAVHRLKTAVPAGNLARMGAIVGGGSDAQVDGVGRLFEAIGLAFQVVDDVLDARGFRGGLKERGEDVRRGKATLPVAKALGRLPPAERARLWSALAARPEGAAAVADVLATLEGCGALDACLADARALVEAGFRAFDPLVPDSLPKAMLEAFGAYVLERHY